MNNILISSPVMMDEPKFAQPIPNVTVAGNGEKSFNDLWFFTVPCYFNILQQLDEMRTCLVLLSI